MARINAAVETFKGLKANIHCLDNLSPVSRVAIYVRAGSRYEPAAVPGISHFLRASARLTTEKSSLFGITRGLQTNGASFNILADREHIIYRIDCLRDKLQDSLKLVSDTISCPEFRSWELVDYTQGRLKYDLETHKKDQRSVLCEALNKAAFRGGLAHSMYTPEHQISKIKKEHLVRFFSDNYVPSRMTIVGLGVAEEELVHCLRSKTSLNLDSGEYKGVGGASRYVGGEARLQAPFNETMVALVGKAPGLNDSTGCINLRIFEAILGGFGPGIKYSVGSERSLAASVAAVSPLVRTSIINISYSDVGLFGFTLHGPNEALSAALKAATKHVQKSVKGVTQEDLSIAKNVIKAKSLIESENHDSVFASMGTLAANGVASADITNVDKATIASVTDTMYAVIKGKETLVSVGNPRYIPYVDEL